MCNNDENDMLGSIQPGMHYQTAFMLEILYKIFKMSGYIFFACVHLKLVSYFYKVSQKNQKYISLAQKLILLSGFWSLSISFALLSGFDFLEVYQGFLLQILIVMIPFIFLFKLRKSQHFTPQILAILIGIFAVQALINYSLQEICVCLFNKKYGWALFDPIYQVSTILTRQLYLPSGKICKDSEICHVYMSLGENADTEVYLGAQGGTNIENLIVEYCVLDETTQQCISSFQTFEIAKNFINLEKKGERNMFKQKISNLQPNTMYHFRYSHYENSQSDQKKTLKLLESTNYKTLSSFDMAQNITVAIGGDSGITDAALQLVGRLKYVQPDVIIIGGDVSYDDGLQSCYYSWDTFLEMWEQELFQPLNRTIPFIYSLGNHDVGFNAMQGAEPHHKTPLIFEYFDFSDTNQYFYHNLIGNTILFSLDPGYYVEPSKQIDYINQISEKYQNHTKFAQYHVPIYPACFEESDIWGDDRLAMNEMEKHWVPVFEQQNFLGAFENHGHQFKRTFPIVQREVNFEKGVTYFGDGSFGLDPPYICPDNFQMNKTQGIFENIEHYDSSHIWIIEIGKEQIRFDALTPKGQYLEKDFYRNHTRITN